MCLLCWTKLYSSRMCLPVLKIKIKKTLEELIAEIRRSDIKQIIIAARHVGSLRDIYQVFGGDPAWYSGHACCAFCEHAVRSQGAIPGRRDGNVAISQSGMAEDALAVLPGTPLRRDHGCGYQ